MSIFWRKRKFRPWRGIFKKKAELFLHCIGVFEEWVMFESLGKYLWQNDASKVSKNWGNSFDFQKIQNRWLPKFSGQQIGINFKLFTIPSTKLKEKRQSYPDKINVKWHLFQLATYHITSIKSYKKLSLLQHQSSSIWHFFKRNKTIIPSHTAQ